MKKIKVKIGLCVCLSILTLILIFFSIKYQIKESTDDIVITAQELYLMDGEQYGFWNMIGKTEQEVMKSLKQRQTEYVVYYHYRQENQTLIEFRDNLKDYSGIGKVQAYFIDGKFVVGAYIASFVEDTQRTALYERLGTELSACDVQEEISSEHQFIDGNGNRIDILLVGAEENDEIHPYRMVVMFRCQ